MKSLLLLTFISLNTNAYMLNGYNCANSPKTCAQIKDRLKITAPIRKAYRQNEKNARYEKAIREAQRAQHIKQNRFDFQRDLGTPTTLLDILHPSRRRVAMLEEQLNNPHSALYERPFYTTMPGKPVYSRPINVPKKFIGNRSAQIANTNAWGPMVMPNYMNQDIKISNSHGLSQQAFTHIVTTNSSPHHSPRDSAKNSLDGTPQRYRRTTSDLYCGDNYGPSQATPSIRSGR